MATTYSSQQDLSGRATDIRNIDKFSQRGLLAAISRKTLEDWARKTRGSADFVVTRPRIAMLALLRGASRKFGAKRARETSSETLVAELSYDEGIRLIEEAIDELSPTVYAPVLASREAQTDATAPAREPPSEASRPAILRSQVSLMIANRLSRARHRALARLFAATTHWGPCLSSPSARRKVANTAEVLAAITDADLDDEKHRTITASAIDWLLSTERNGRFPSLSRDVITTQCTALASLALRHVHGLSQVSGPDRQRAFATSLRSANACFEIAGDRAWGTFGAGAVRMQPTIWALRAIAGHLPIHSDEVKTRFTQLRAMHSLGAPGCFGFAPGKQRRVSTTASFLLLL